MCCLVCKDKQKILLFENVRRVTERLISRACGDVVGEVSGGLSMKLVAGTEVGALPCHTLW